MDGLTPKQQLFVEAYVSNGLNATEACRQAGYTGNANTLKQVGFQNLTKPNLRAAIDIELAKVREQYAERRAGLLSDVDEVKTEIDAVKTAFPDNPNVRVQLIARRLDAIEKEAKLTGAYIKDAENPADLKSVARTVAEFRQRIATDAEIYAATNGKYGHPMPDESFVEAEIGKLLKTHKVLPEQLATEMGKYTELGRVD